jgi:sugar phosphate isomerase/epimerase
MQLSFHSLHFTPLFGGTASLLDVLAGTAAGGFRSIGLDLWSIDAHLATGGTVASVRRAMDDNGLLCTDLAVLLVTADRASTVATATRIAGFADVLGGSICGVAIASAVDRAAMVRTLRDCASVVTDHGMRLAIEYTPYSPIGTLEHAFDLCEAIGWNRAGIMLDSLHVARTGTSYDDIRNLDASTLPLVQFSDASAAPEPDVLTDSRHFRLLPGDGELPLDQFVAAVRSTGFDGIVAAEVLSRVLRHDDPAYVAARIHDALLRYWPAEPRSG